MAPSPLQRRRTLSTKMSSPSGILRRLGSFFYGGDEKRNDGLTTVNPRKAAEFEDVGAVPAPLQIAEKATSAGMSSMSGAEFNRGPSQTGDYGVQDKRLSATQKKNRNRKAKKKKQVKGAAPALTAVTPIPLPYKELLQHTKGSRPLFSELAADESKYNEFIANPEKRASFFNSITALTETAAETLAARRQESGSALEKSADELEFEADLETLCREGKQMLEWKEDTGGLWEQAEEMGVTEENLEDLMGEIDLSGVTDEMLKNQYVLQDGEWGLKVPDEEYIKEAKKMYDGMLAGEWQDFLGVPSPPQLDGDETLVEAAGEHLAEAVSSSSVKSPIPSRIPAPMFPLRHSFTRDGVEWQERPGQILRRMSKSESLRELAATQPHGAGETGSVDHVSDQGYGSGSDRPGTPAKSTAAERPTSAQEDNIEATAAISQVAAEELRNLPQPDSQEMKRIIADVFPALLPYESALASHQEWLENFRQAQQATELSSPVSPISRSQPSSDEDASIAFQSRRQPLLSKCRTPEERRAVRVANGDRNWRRIAPGLSSPEYVHPIADRSLKVNELAKEDRVRKMEEEGMKKLMEKLSRMGGLKQKVQKQAYGEVGQYLDESWKDAVG
ncbi:hypothetical protein CKM354_000506200 [Cercospora kikuchii]|uniref:Uncharacterized protein n=1 Tax=Cercospora kikuchii TaxID=84275 RepID=A0A9P3CI15_9PEZI|nr:uncharacterized protein CKM354_000506200 [Cercospora kikuchii]GIZ41767.1 hypothetical protein CKM354_000506200 [Cercospora kikuchii]